MFKEAAVKNIVLALLVSFGLLAGPPAGAVTFGQPDGNAHPFVGTLLFKRADGYFSCTATSLSATVLLTAGHCTESAGETNLRTWASFAPSISFAGIGGYPSIDAFFDDPINGWVKGTPIPHPQYDDFAAFPRTFDIGVVLLDQAVPHATYGVLAPLDFLTTIHKSSDDRFTIVGYGQQGILKPFASDIYARYNGQVRLTEIKSTRTGGQSAKFSNNPGIGGGTCFGDSGGPIFHADTNMIVAVVSFGYTPCIGNDYNFRTDIPAARDFVTPYL